MNEFAKCMEWLEEKSNKIYGRRTNRERFYGHLECAAAHAAEGNYLSVEHRLRAARRFYPVREDQEEIAQRIEYIYEVCLKQSLHYAQIAQREGSTKEAEFYRASARTCAYHLEKQVSEEELSPP